MKIVHLMGPLRPSGMERMLVSSARHFAALGVEALVIGQGDAHPFASDIRDAGLRVRTIPPVTSLSGQRGFYRILRDADPDVVHIHTEGKWAPTVATVRIAAPKAQIVRTVHSVFQNVGSAAVSRRAQAFMADRFVGAFVAPAPGVAENEVGYGRRCRVVYNWVDDRFRELRTEREAFAPLSDRTRRSIVIVGNSSPIKNQIRVLEAIMPTTLDLYMYGAESGASGRERELLDSLQAAGRLRHRGVGDPAEGLVQASAYAMPSLLEGMGVALAEALTVGTPSYIADSPGLGWATDLSGVTALPNERSAWAQAMAELDSPSEQTPFVIPGGNVDFTAERGAREYFGIYRDLTENRG